MQLEKEQMQLKLSHENLLMTRFEIESLESYPGCIVVLKDTRMLF